MEGQNPNTTPTPKVQSYNLWYHSASHGKDRYFTGFTVKLCNNPSHPKGHPYPAWSYNKEDAFTLDGEEGQKVYAYATMCGYTGLKLQPLDAPPDGAKLEELEISPEVKAMLSKFAKPVAEKLDKVH